MAGFGDLVQKAFYLGVGIASYASEKAGSTFSELRSQAQKLADEMVARGEMTADEAKKMVDDMVTRAQQQAPKSSNTADTQSADPSPGPRRIDILSDDESSPEENPQAVESLRDQVSKLQDELRRLKKD
ncbi:MAG: phasin family protein [Oculatellaceae cyanobacterium Prado106]|jgi:polyhydroxyalkanoate synthesis regulator phasin|nr:phasin family protein [Oculatellaceae cyanobacterium Prado106]